jgi:predicted lipase
MLSDEESFAISSDHYASAGGSSGELKRVRMTMYNFGTPRVGNWHFASELNRWVPNSYRVGE